MNVLSLFDGLSGGRVALERAKIPVKKYYSSEIDEYAISIADKNYPKDTKYRLGDVTKLNKKQLKKIKIDLLIGGSPCQGFSISGKLKGSSTTCGVDVVSLKQYLKLKEDGFKFDGQSYLFWEFIRVLKICKPKYFMLENVRVTKKWLPMFNEALGCEPIFINSNLVSAQNRPRYYWTNINISKMPKDRGIILQDIIEKTNKVCKGQKDIKFIKIPPSVKKNIIEQHEDIIKSDKVIYNMKCTTGFQINRIGLKKSRCLGVSNTSFYILDKENLVYKKLTPLEWERLQTLPDNYTEGVSDTQRYKMIGNGWTIDVVKNIFKGLRKHV